VHALAVVPEITLPGVWALVAAVFVASVLGSTHCAGMCGGLLLFAVGHDLRSKDPARRGSSRLSLHLAYHGGRLATYSLLGGVMGSVGAALDLGGRLVGLQQAALVTAGSLMIGFGVVSIARSLGVHIPKLPVPGPMRRIAEAGHRRAFGLGPVQRALVIGLLTAFLPCGWLYAFAVVAAGAGHPALGALVMAVFWAGTLPVLGTLGAGMQLAAGRLGRHAPLVTALVVVAVGMFTIAQRTRLTGLVPAQPAITPVSLSDAAHSARDLDHTQAPCCALSAAAAEGDAGTAAAVRP
jgi:sulfite exporter TauE/SafE